MLIVIDPGQAPPARHRKVPETKLLVLIIARNLSTAIATSVTGLVYTLT